MLIALRSLKKKEVISLIHLIKEDNIHISAVFHDNTYQYKKHYASETTAKVHLDSLDELAELMSEHQVTKVAVSFDNCEYTINALHASLTVFKRPDDGRNYWTDDAIKSIGIVFGDGGIRKMTTEYSKYA
jgi:hypothetical protein